MFSKSSNVAKSLSFNSSVNVTCHDVPVWNMNNVWCESVAGITSALYEDFTKFGSFPYLGSKYPLEAGIVDVSGKEVKKFTIAKSLRKIYLIIFAN